MARTPETQRLVKSYYSRLSITRRSVRIRIIENLLYRLHEEFGFRRYIFQEFILKPLPTEEPAPKRPGTVPMIPDIPEAMIAEAGYDNGGFDEGTETNPRTTLREYLLSILYMPHSMRMLCLTNLFCWMAHVCYSLYFTDFVGEAVYGGDPKVRPPSTIIPLASFIPLQ